MKIPAPIATVGERVEVRNYRRRSNTWETGELVYLAWSPPRTLELLDGKTQTYPGWWTYDVEIHRPRLGGFAKLVRYQLRVSDGGTLPMIRRITPAPLERPTR